MLDPVAKTAFRLIRMFAAAAVLSILAIAGGCETVNDSRIPAMPVNINLADNGMWTAYGVSGFGDFRYFIFSASAPREPSGFPYTDRSATGYGGVLLIEGIDPFNDQAVCPMAYDLSCPVEKSPNVRVAIDVKTLEAVCPVCDSHYNVVSAAGSPVSGEAVTLRYGLKRYSCHAASTGGYIITDRR